MQSLRLPQMPPQMRPRDLLLEQWPPRPPLPRQQLVDGVEGRRAEVEVEMMAEVEGVATAELMVVMKAAVLAGGSAAASQHGASGCRTDSRPWAHRAHCPRSVQDCPVALISGLSPPPHHPSTPLCRCQQRS